MAIDQELEEKRRQALARFFEARPRSRSGLCKRAGVSEATVRAYLSGENQTMGMPTWDKLAAAAGVDVRELRGEAESVRRTFLREKDADHIRGADPALGLPYNLGGYEDLPPSNVKYSNVVRDTSWTKQARVPVMGTGQGGNGDGEFELNTGDPIDFISRPPKLEFRKNVFAIYLDGDSMADVHDDGDLLFIDRDRKPFPGRDALIELKARQDGAPMKALVKRVLKINSEFVEVKQFNPDKTWRIDRKDIENLFLVLKNHEMY